jgi:hypothetical protein
MANPLRITLFLSAILAALALPACRTADPAPGPTDAPTLKLAPTHISTPFPRSTATLVIPLTPTRTQTAGLVITTAPTRTSTNTPRPPSTPLPTLPPLTRIAAAESVRQTAIAEEQKTLLPTVSQTPAALNTYQLIDLDWMRGEIDIDHSAVFKVLTLFGVGSPIVPSRYIVSVPLEGDGTGLFLYAVKDWDKMSPATQTMLADFMTPRVVTPETRSAGPTPTPAIPLPHRVYATNISRGETPNGELSLFGEWEFDLTTGAVTLNGERVITRSYYQEDNRVIFEDDYGSLACNPDSGKGTYTWHAEGNSISFTLISDACESRSQVLTAHPWVKP